MFSTSSILYETWCFSQQLTDTSLKESLKFPKHITTQFNAVFYDYDLHETGIPGKGSPYVGSVDLEQFYVNQYLKSGKVLRDDILTKTLCQKQNPTVSNNNSTLTKIQKK